MQMVGVPGAHSGQGQVCTMAASLCGSFYFPAFSAINLQFSRLSFSLLELRKANFGGLKGELVGPRWVWMPGRPPNGPGPQRGQLLPSLSLCNEFSNPASWWNDIYGQNQCFNLILMWFPLRECWGLKLFVYVVISRGSGTRGKNTKTIYYRYDYFLPHSS